MNIQSLENEMEMMKLSFKCGDVLFQKLFYALKLTKDNLYSSCMVCVIQGQED